MMQRKIWIVEEGDYDSQWPVAAYESQKLADEHAKEMSLRVWEVEVLTALPAEVTDPAKRKKRAAKILKAQRQYRREQAAQEKEHRKIEALKPLDELRDGGTLDLCSCRTFADDPMWTANGYCRYCGGWEPELIRLHCGEAELLRQIDKLDHDDRTSMMAICGIAVGV